MRDSADLGEMIREDAITSVNLAEIKAAAAREGEQFYIFSNQGAHLEEETGADFQWGALGAFWVVQAKRLDAVPAKGGATYTIKLPQLFTVISRAVALTTLGTNYQPAYVFYNSMTDVFGDDRAQAGCVYVNASGLLDYIYRYRNPTAAQQTVSLSARDVLSAGAQPWYLMFPEQVVVS